MSVAHRACGTAIACALAAATLGVAAPASSAADWTRPFNISALLSNTSSPSVGIDDQGGSLAAWVREISGTPRIEARPIAANGTPGTVAILSPSTGPADKPQVVMNGAGAGAVVYEFFDGSAQRLVVRRRSAAGTLSAQQTVSEAGANVTDFDAGIDDAGRVIMLWRTSNGVRMRIRATNGVLSSSTLLASGDNVDDPRMATNGAGDSAFVWVDLNTFIIRTRVLPNGGSISATQTLSSTGSTQPDVGIDGTGRLIAVWTRSDGANNLIKIEARARRLDGVVGSVRVVESNAEIEPVFGPRIATGANGVSGAAYREETEGDGGIIVNIAKGATLSSTVQPTAPVTLTLDNQDAGQPEIAIDDTGASRVVWPVNAGAISHIISRPLSATGVRGARRTLSELSQSMATPAIAINGAGAASAVWHGNNETSDLVQGALLTP